PTQTVVARSPPKPENHASRCSLVEPVLPPTSSRPSTLAREPVPRWTTSRIIDTIWQPTRSSIARGATIRSSGGAASGTSAAATSAGCGAGRAGPRLKPPTSVDALTDEPPPPAQLRQAVAGF